MRVRRFVPLSIALVSFSLGGSLPARAGQGLSVTISTDDDEALEDCDDIEVRFGSGRHALEVARAESVFRASRSEIQVLRAALPDAGGISVRGWDGDGYEIKVCKAAGAAKKEAAEALLGRITASVRNGEIAVSGPEEKAWVAYVLVRAPAGSPVDLEARNGGISLHDLSDSRIRVRTRNGPVALRDCSGDIRVDAENGPIDFSGGGGNVALHAENGPIAVALASKWEGEGLEVRTENGPLALKLPANPSSGIRIQASSNSPVSCKAEACAGARKTWDDDHRVLELGGSPVVVRMFTVNGPVSVDSQHTDTD